MLVRSMRGWFLFRFLMLCILVSAAPLEAAWNNPYPPQESTQNIFYSSFGERPNHLDPARSYSSNEITFTGQIYEPPLQYHYLKRPYELIPLAAESMPQTIYLDAQSQPLGDHPAPESIAYTLYRISIRPGILYQPHPAFARDVFGAPSYLDMGRKRLRGMNKLSDFRETGTRELVASDYVYEIKRLAHPALQSPIFGLMSEYIVGLADYAKTLQTAWDALKKKKGENAFLDLQRYDLEGVRATGRYTYEIKIYGKYPQMKYWLAMPFFAPMPPEADRFYSQPGMKQRNITLDWYPVGTGPYMLTVNNPNRKMVLERNPNFRGEPYPSEGEPGDAEQGLLKMAGKSMPFIDKAVYSLEKEAIPQWTKFLQGYYDVSGINSDSFDQAIQFGAQGDVGLTPNMREKGIKLKTTVQSSIFYLGFNMLDPVVGGNSERAKKLRQAIAIAADYEEYIAIFSNGRGIPAQGPIPPGIFGYREGKQGINPLVYDWIDGKAVRKPLTEALRLMKEAGYENGIDAQTGKPLTLYFDVTATGPDDKAVLDWWRKQFDKLHINLVIRNTTYNRFQEKMLKGTEQLFRWGWNADYPDPENFLFLLYGPNKKVGKGGENAANYENAEFDALFVKMKNMDNGPERQAIIDRMVDIVRRDSPWLWGINPKSFALYHAWYGNAKPNLMANNGLKYKTIDAKLRHDRREQWNQPVLWPLFAALALIIAFLVPGFIGWWRREHGANL